MNVFGQNVLKYVEIDDLDREYRECDENDEYRGLVELELFVS